jgi:putative ABC transport system permease protein
MQPIRIPSYGLADAARPAVLTMQALWLDIRHAFCTLAKSPGFTVIALLTLVLGIGANTAIFSVVQGAVLAPLPYRDPGRLVLVWLNNLTLKSVTDLSYADFLDWERDSRSFEQMGAIAWQGYDLAGPGAPEHLNGMQVSSGLFSTLGVTLPLGRDFVPEEDRHGAAPVVIISDRLWRAGFAASQDVLGKSVVLTGVSYAVVGVLPPGFRFADEADDVYLPIGQPDARDTASRTIHDVMCVARLRPGITLAEAQAEMDTIQQRLDERYPSAERGLGVKIHPLKEDLVGDIRGTLLLLLGAVGLVLLIACANVANLLLVRSTARNREFAIRLALGAGRSRIVRQLITESVMLSLLGGALGLCFAKWGASITLATLPGGPQRMENIALSVPVFAFTFGAAVLVGILFGLAPALKSSKTDLQHALKEGSRSATVGSRRAQNALVIFQMALTLMLLAGAGLLFRTIRQLWEVNPGFDAQHVITFKIGLEPALAKTAPGLRTAFDQLLDRIRAIPGVQAADVTTLIPLSAQMNSIPFYINSERPASFAEAPRALLFSVGPDYFRVMGIPLIRGRFITKSDNMKSPQVAVIDTALARAYFDSTDPVGQTISFPTVGPFVIVGVVAHIHHSGLGTSSPFTENQIYGSFFQISDYWMPIMTPAATIVVRSPLDAATLMPLVKDVVQGAGGEQTIYNVQTMPQIVSESLSPQRFPLMLLATFAALALGLASVGIYGVISYSVALRKREIGIRLALGAEKRDVFGMVIWQGLQLVAAGLAIGAVGALILTRLLSSFSHLLYGVAPSDPLTFTVVSLVLAAVAVLACYIPARRAARVDPMVVLRYE